MAHLTVALSISSRAPPSCQLCSAVLPPYPLLKNGPENFTCRGLVHCKAHELQWISADGGTGLARCDNGGLGNSRREACQGKLRLSREASETFIAGSDQVQTLELIRKRTMDAGC